MAQIRRILAENMRRLRAERGWTQPDLAEKCGVSFDQIKKIESCSSWVSSDAISKIATAFKCYEAELFRDPEAVPPVTARGAIALFADLAGLEIKVTGEKPSPGCAHPDISAIPNDLAELLNTVDWNDRTVLQNMRHAIEGFQKKKRLPSA